MFSLLSWGFTKMLSLASTCQVFASNRPDADLTSRRLAAKNVGDKSVLPNGIRRFDRKTKVKNKRMLFEAPTAPN